MFFDDDYQGHFREKFELRRQRARLRNHKWDSDGGRDLFKYATAGARSGRWMSDERREEEGRLVRLRSMPELGGGLGLSMGDRGGRSEVGKPGRKRSIDEMGLCVLLSPCMSAELISCMLI